MTTQPGPGSATPPAPGDAALLTGRSATASLRSHRLQLTEAGAELVRTVDDNEALLVTEKAFLSELMPLNDARVARLSAWQGK